MQNFQLPKAPEIKFFQSAEYARKIEKAKNRLRAKPFIERFKTMNILANIGIIFFPTISVITGIAFLHVYVGGVITHPFISMSISMMLLIFLELVKNHLLNNGLDTFFSNSGKSVLTFVFAFLFSVGSFIMSYQGAELLVKSLDNSKQQIVDSTSAKLLAIEKKYENLILSEQFKIVDLKKKAKSQWKGLNTPEQNKLLVQYEDNIKYFRNQTDKEKSELKSSKEDQLKKAETKVVYNAYVFKVFAAINELLTILSILFTAFYTFKTVREDLDLSDFRNQPEKYSMAEPTFKTSIEIEPQVAKTSLNKSDQRNVVTGFYKDDYAIVNNDTVNDEMVDSRQVDVMNCKNCQKEFKPYNIIQKFCSKECRLEWHKENKGFELEKYLKRKH